MVLEYNALKEEYELLTPLPQRSVPLKNRRPIRLPHTPQRLFLLGGRDLEMQTIRELLLRKSEWIADKHLNWQNARLSRYAEECRTAIKMGIPIYGIELHEDIPLPPQYHRIDHHNEHAGEPSALEQLMELLHESARRYHQLVACNDKGYIPGLKAMGATQEEIAVIRKADRKAQGITQEEEWLAEKSITMQSEKIGEGWIVKALCSTFSPICDRLYPYEWLLMYTDKEWTYYGKKAKAMIQLFDCKEHEKRLYYGGGDNGYVGTVSGAYTTAEINKMIELIIAYHQ